MLVKNWLKRIHRSDGVLEPFVELTLHIQSSPPMNLPLRVTLLIVVANPDDQVQVYERRDETNYGVLRSEQQRLAREGYKNLKKRFTFAPEPGQPERLKIEGSRIYGLQTSEDIIVRWYIERDGLSIWNQGQITTDIELDLERMGG